MATAVACVWSTAGAPQGATAAILFGRRKLLRALGAGTGKRLQGQGCSWPSRRPCWDSVLSLLGLQVRLVGPAWWSFEGPQGTAATVGCCQGLLLQGEWPAWGSQAAPALAGQRLQQVYSETAGAPSPPGRAAGVYPEEAPSAGSGCRLGWLGGQGGGPQGGADYLLVSQVVYAEERMLLPGAVFS